MADSTLAALGAHTPIVDADSSYIENGGVAKKVAASVWKTYVSASPVLVTPNLGTPSAGVISACTSTNMVLVTPDLGTPSALVLTNASGTVTNLTLVTPALGTPASGVISACTSTDMVLVTPDLGTPSAIVLTNATGTVTSLTLVTPALGVVASGNIAACTGINVALAAHIAGGAVEEVTATVDGTGTGLITGTSEFVSVICDDVTKQVSLPAAVDGKVLRILGGGANNFEVISAVAGDKVNNVIVGATNEALLVKTTLYTLVYDESTENWIMQGATNQGAVETPVVPDGV